MKQPFVLLAIAAILLAGASVSRATSFTLTSNNANMTIDDASQNGSFLLSIDGINQVFQGQLWYRIGSSGPEISIDNLGPAVFSSTTNTLNETYTSPNQFSVAFAWQLTGGTAGSGTAMYTENFDVKNLSNSALDFHLFDYRDFDLSGDGSTDSVAFASSSVVQQDSSTIATTTFGLAPSEVEAGLFPTTLAKLDDANTDTLNGNTTIGPGDATWAAQWDQSIAVSNDLSINTTTTFGPSPVGVPLPTSAWMGLALLPLAAFIRRRRLARIYSREA